MTAPRNCHSIVTRDNQSVDELSVLSRTFGSAALSKAPLRAAPRGRKTLANAVVEKTNPSNAK
jgi:hypothetical protein